MRAASALLYLLILLALATPVALGLMAVEKSPLVQANSPIDSRDYDRAEKLIRRAQYALADRRTSTTISASQLDLDSLAAFLSRSVNGVKGTVVVVPEGVRVLASYELPHNPVGRYVNLAVTVRTSPSRLDVVAIDIGRIHLGPWLARPVVNLLASTVLGAKLGDDVISAVRGLEVEDQRVTLMIRPDATLESRFKERVTDVAILARPPAVADYYRQILEIASKYDQVTPVPFVNFLQPLLLHAEERSVNGDPVAEMHAMVFALAIYFGGERLDRLRDALLPADLAGILQLTDYVVVRGRHDHVQHFIVSAAFTLSGGIGFTTTIGEAKEFDDLLRGGSDFSFQDIAADRAGIAFGRLANTPAGARFLESLGHRAPSEDLFFPVVSDLPDGMEPRRFDRIYHDTDSAAFKAMLAKIDKRIRACGAYASSN
jgi:hypothetical protein